MMELDLSDAVTVDCSRLKSAVWNDFDRVKSGDMLIAICRHCKRRMSASGTSGTSHLKNHLIRCQKRLNHDIGQRQLTFMPQRGKKRGRPPKISFTQGRDEELPALIAANVKSEGDIIAPLSTFDQRRSELDLARMIVLHGYPFAMVEHVGFQTFIKNVQPLFDIAVSDKVEADCFEIYQKEKQKFFEVLDKLPGKISLSIDVWLSPDDSKWFELNAHFIDDSWQLKKKMLNFLRVEASLTEDMQSDLIMKCLMDWDIDRKSFSMTWDGCSMKTIISTIKDRLSQNRFLFAGGQLFDVPCLSSVLKQMVEVALEPLSDIVPKIRESVRYVKSSQPIIQKFIEMANQENVEGRKCLSLDNKFRWDSTFRMLDSAVVYKSAFSLLREDDVDFQSCPSDTDWEKVSSVTGFLNVFLDIINDFTQRKYPTANMFFPFVCDIFVNLIEWCESSDEFIRSVAEKMRQRFNFYWEKCGFALGIATFLDPRFKMKMVEYYFPQIYGPDAQFHIDAVRDRIKALYNEHSIGFPLAADENGVEWQIGAGDSGPGPTSKDRLSGFEKFLHETSQVEAVVVKSDLDKYLEEPLFPRNVDFCILNWWKVHYSRYPILSMMARNVLGIQISKVSSDSAFDFVGHTLDHDRSSLSPASLQALMCAKSWIGSELES